MNSDSRKSRVALLSVISNTALMTGKIVIGLLIGSVAVISEAIHSGVDLLAAVIAWFAVRQSARPADAEHEFGHGKFENASGTIEALLIFVAAGWIIYEAVRKLIHPIPLESPHLGVAVMLASVLVNLWVSARLFKVGRETDSVALQADAWHLRTDVWTSLGVMAALVVIWLHELFFPARNIHWLDPLVAIGVALMIVKAAYQLTVQAGRDLLDTSLPKAEEHWIQDYLANLQTPVNGYHGLRTRKAGAMRYIELHLEVEPALTVAEAHQHGDLVSAAIERQYPGASVIVHLDPYLDEDKVALIQKPD